MKDLSFRQHWDHLFTFDIIRLCKLGEIVQYSFIFLVLCAIITYFLNKYYYYYVPSLRTPTGPEKTVNKLILFYNFLLIFIDIVIVAISFFYIRKIGLLVPSIPALLYKKFKPHTTMEYTVHIALVVFFIELLPRLKERIDIWNEELLELDHSKIKSSSH